VEHEEEVVVEREHDALAHAPEALHLLAGDGRERRVHAPQQERRREADALERRARAEALEPLDVDGDVRKLRHGAARFVRIRDSPKGPSHGQGDRA
jgi:hypothetical protein